jgi:2-iminobutanoate/2-iminopropanoate deaminase
MIFLQDKRTNMNVRNFFAIAFVALLTALASDSSAQETRRYINPSTVADSATGPFSGAVMVGNTLYLSGTIGLDENRQVPASAEQEARNVLNNVRGTLEAAGMSMDDLVSVQVFCSDVAHYDAFNRVYRTFFTAEFPARAFLGAGTLLFGARFEVQGIAARR